MSDIISVMRKKDISRSTGQFSFGPIRGIVNINSILYYSAQSANNNFIVTFVCSYTAVIVLAIFPFH